MDWLLHCTKVKHGYYELETLDLNVHCMFIVYCILYKLCLHVGTVFPKELQAYCLNEELLAKVFSQVLSGQEQSLVWHLRGVPDYGFYQDLHYFITRCPQTSTLTKVSLG